MDRGVARWPYLPLLLLAGCGGSAAAPPAGGSSAAGRPGALRPCPRQDLQVRARYRVVLGDVEAVGAVYDRSAVPCRLKGTPTVIVRAERPLRYDEQGPGRVAGAPSGSSVVALSAGPRGRFAEFRLVWRRSCPAAGRAVSYAHAFVRLPGVSGLLPVHPRAAAVPRCDPSATRRRSLMTVSALFAGRPGEGP